MEFDLKDDSLLSMIQTEGNKYEHSIESLRRKQTGSYYTDITLTKIMVKELIYSLDETTKKTLYRKKFFEPCVGTGNFVFAYLDICKELSFSREQYRELLNNIYACDINQDALQLYCKNLALIAKQWFDIDLNENYFNSHIGGGLLYNVDTNTPQYISINTVFPEEVIANGFDIIATNPPYKNLKVERGHYNKHDEYSLDKKKYDLIAQSATKNFKFSNTGIINLYKLFVEEILTEYLASNGVCSLLLPSSILSDKTCGKLRTYILKSCGLKSIRLIPESSTYIDASQALCSLLIHKEKETTEIYVDGSFNGRTIKGAIIDINDIVDTDTDNAILVLTENEYSIRNRMKQFPKIKEIAYIKNKRGELDLTLNKTYISKKITKFQLLRGRNIGYYKIIDLPEKEFVSDSFVSSTAKNKHIKNTRLVCQQIANMSKKRRVSFALIPPNTVLGNSCNYISIEENPDNIDEYFLLGVLNSSLIDWFFNLTSSNNHINNYEIDNFPIPIHCDERTAISQSVKKYLDTFDESILNRIDFLVYKAYQIDNPPHETSSDDSIYTDRNAYCQGLFNAIKNIIPNITYDECKSILENRASIKDICFQKKLELNQFDFSVLNEIEKKFKKLSQDMLLNHTTFKLSDLDIEMISSVPQGGNWKNIPASTIKKSKRLIRITETGGRTTLYGRIEYGKPAYTITTYFNRPGNGTYVHPIHNRVISVREAARFQTFPDDYYFCGNKTDMLNQVGNAVPVLLAYSIGKAIKEKLGCNTSVDLFSGAGGMTYGFKLAGIHAAVATDISQKACQTLKVNSPEIPVICGDITDDNIKSTIISYGKTCEADIICGGPPCQGFSLAGFRDKNDPRNQLFRHFVDVVSVVKPKVIVFENVEGLLSFENGATYRNIIELFSELGYYTEGRKLSANEYGVPQKRRRVIILCVRKDLGVKPHDIYPLTTTPCEEQQITAYETIYDLENIACSENAIYETTYSSNLIKYFRGEIDAEQYEQLICKKKPNGNNMIQSKMKQASIFDILYE